MAGIYGDIVFHLGASSRIPVFAKDINNNLILKFINRYRNAPLMWRLHSHLIKKIHNKNKKIFDAIKSNLRKDPEKFFCSLMSKQYGL